MSQLEQLIDKELGIVDTSNIGQWSQVESFIDSELGIETIPEPTFEEKEKRIRDVFDISDELELSYNKVINEYDEIQRQKKEFPFGQLQAGEDEFSARKLFSGLWDKVKPPPLGEASPGQLFFKLKNGMKGVGHVATEYLIGRRTMGFGDMLAAPAEAFYDVYLANRKLRKDLIAQGNTVKDVGSKYDPAWKITDTEGNVEFIRPNTVADKEFVSSVSELYDRIVGLEVSPSKKKFFEIAKVIGTFRAASRLRGPMPSHIGTLGKAGHAFQIGTIYGIATELQKGVTGNESYRGALAITEDGIILAGLSLIGSGVKGIWNQLKLTEQRKALKILGLTRRATEEDIIAASRRAFLRYHPDKVAGMQAEFQKAVKARNILLNPDYGKDIIVRGRPPSTVKLLTGVTEEGVPIKPAKPPIKVEPAPPLEPVVAAPEAKVPAEGIKVPPKAEKPVKIAKEAVTEGKAAEIIVIKNPLTPKGELRENLESIHQKKNILKPKKDRVLAKLKKFVSTVPEFAEKAEFVVEDGMLVFRDGGRFRFVPDVFGLEADQLKEGQIIKFDLESYGIKIPSAKKIAKVRELGLRAPEELRTDDELNKLIDDFRPGFVDIEPYVESLKTAHDWVFTFGEAKRLNPELFDKLMESYGRRNASVEKAISILKRVVPENITAGEAMELAMAYEDKTLPPPEGLEETYKGFADLLGKIEERSIKEGIFKQTFQERMIAENEAKIDALKEKLLHPNKSKRIAELVAENEQLRQMRYLPHSIVARRTIENKLLDLKGEERKTYLDSIARISAKFKKRTGKLLMKDYLEVGILKPGDIDIRRLTANALTDYYYRAALKDLFDYAAESELIKPTSDALRKEGWQNQQEIGIISPELKGKVVHPLLASSLSEMKEMKLGKGSGMLRQVLSMIKIGQFIKPSIIWTYNAIQAYMKGMYFFNPVKSHHLLTESFKSVIAKDALYHKLNESNLYQFPYEVSRGSFEEQIDQYIRQNSPEISRLTKLLEKTTDMTWKVDDLDLKKMIMVGHRALANLTWTGDKVQRTHSYLILEKMGYPHDEAVKVAAHSHGAYSVLSERYKKFMSPITFVYSFRLLMPIEIAKILTEPLIGIPNAFIRGEQIPRYKWNRWAKSWVGAVAIPVLTDMYMKERGFEKEGKHLGPLAWKWKKTILLDGKKQEIVVGINNILNIPVKYWNRITYYNPIRPEARWQQSINNLIKWEIHPLWRIFFWDIKENRKSFGTGLNVYDPNDPALKQLGQTFLYIFGQSFRFWGGMMDAVGEGDMTEKERKAQEEVFDEGLTKLDKFLFTVFGYKYVRAPLEERKAIAMASLQKEMTSRVIKISKKYEGKELKERQEDLKRWAKKCEKWIREGMK